MILLALLASLLFVYSLMSGRLDGTIVTAPMVFTAAGMLAFPVVKAVINTGVDAKIFFFGLAEVGLVMLLFTDASQTNLTVLLSIFVHGVSAMPGISLYERKIAALPNAAPEHQDVKAGSRYVSQRKT